MTSIVDMNTLYPVVHDLTEAEYSIEGLCCDDNLCALLTRASGSIQEFLYHSTPTTDPRSPSNQSVDCLLGTTTNEQTNAVLSRQDGENTTNATEQGEHDSQAPASFDDFYVLTRQIGRSATATVCEVVDRRTGLRYAAKIIDRRFLLETEENEVYAEVELIKCLGENPTGTLLFVDFFDEPIHFYIVTEYAQGGNLMKHMDKERFTDDQAKQLIKSLLEGVHYLHNLNICHRDLKPENILLRNSVDMDSVLIAGFRLATRLYQSKGDDQNKLSLLTERCDSDITYVAPEVLKGSPYGTRADMWSVGVVVYMILCGNTPFVEQSTRTLVRKICNGDYSLHAQEWARVPFLAKDFVYRLLQADPCVRMSAEQALQHPWLATQMIPSQLLQQPDNEPHFKSFLSRRSQTGSHHWWHNLACVRKRRGRRIIKNKRRDKSDTSRNHFMKRSILAVTKFVAFILKHFL